MGVECLWVFQWVWSVDSICGCGVLIVSVGVFSGCGMLTVSGCGVFIVGVEC